MRYHIALLGLALFLLSTGCSATAAWGRETEIGAAADDAGSSEVPSATASAKEEAADAGTTEAEAAEREATADAGTDSPAEAEAHAVAYVPDPMALCEAAAEALNPDWRIDACDDMQQDDEQRVARCRAQRAPLRKFERDVCGAVVEGSALFSLDLLLPLAVMERESSTGRLYFDDPTHTYRVETDVCKLELAADRIVSRRPGPKPGTERMSWTYGDQHAVNRQVVRVVSEDGTGGVTINTCVAGEEGLFQTTPREYRIGLVVRATGQRMAGDAEHRRDEVREDPVLQVRLGIQALAEHRDVCPEERRSSPWTWIFVYNTGRCDPDSRQAHAYTLKVLGHFLDACRKGFVPAADGVTSVPIGQVWPGCAEAESARTRLLGE